jgi:DNA-binding SARP family transcriptional activator
MGEMRGRGAHRTGRGGDPGSEAEARPTPGPRISLLGGFRLEDEGAAIVLPEGSQRLLAFLALRGRLVKRPVAAGTLWPVSTEDHASSSLRSALSRLPRSGRAAVEATARDLGLSGGVTVDLWESRALAQRLLAPESLHPEEDEAPAAVSGLSGELLPDWYDEWVLIEAEDWRQLRLHALEALAARLAARARYGDAATAALAAVRAEPLRESPRAALIRVHIAEGNPSEALREFTRYRDLLMVELGVEPTERLRALVAGFFDVTPR